MNNSGNGLVLMTPDGGEPETLATVEESRKWIVAGSAPYPSGWTPDGRYLLLQAANADVWRLGIRRRSRTGADWTDQRLERSGVG